MLMWINLMTQESHIKSKVTDVVSRKLVTPSPLESPTEQNGSKQATLECKSISPWSSFLYNQHQTSSPYSTFFENSLHGTHYDSSYQSVGSECFSDFSTPDTYRPPSSFGDHHFDNSHLMYSDSSLNFNDSSSFTSPGRIVPISSPPYRSPTIPSSNHGKVYSVLYRPDLIKLSSLKNNRKSTNSDHLDPVVFEEEIPDLSFEEKPISDENKSFKSTAHIQIKRNKHCLPSQSRQFEEQRSLEKSPASFDEQSVDAKQEVNANKVFPKQTLSNNSDLQNALRVVCPHNPKANRKYSNDESKASTKLDGTFLPENLSMKDNFFDNLFY